MGNSFEFSWDWDDGEPIPIKSLADFEAIGKLWDKAYATIPEGSVNVKTRYGLLLARQCTPHSMHPHTTKRQTSFWDWTTKWLSGDDRSMSGDIGNMNRLLGRAVYSDAEHEKSIIGWAAKWVMRYREEQELWDFAGFSEIAEQAIREEAALVRAQEGKLNEINK